MLEYDRIDNSEGIDSTRNKLVKSVGCVIFGILLIKILTLINVCATDVMI